jgi:hypothetical protein
MILPARAVSNTMEQLVVGVGVFALVVIILDLCDYCYRGWHARRGMKKIKGRRRDGGVRRTGGGLGTRSRVAGGVRTTQKAFSNVASEECQASALSTDAVSLVETPVMSGIPVIATSSNSLTATVSMNKTP